MDNILIIVTLFGQLAKLRETVGQPVWFLFLEFGKKCYDFKGVLINIIVESEQRKRKLC